LETLAQILFSPIGFLLIMIPGAIALFLLAVWLGMFVIAPRIRRALDRAEAEHEEPGDRPD
jgi:hypothetical protein